MESEVKYFERDDVLFRMAPGQPMENYQGGWGKYEGDSMKVRHEGAAISEEEANELIKANDEMWARKRAKKPAPAEQKEDRADPAV